MASDRLSVLPDELLTSYILSNLSLRDATRCSVLSRRWRYLSTLLPHLKFSFECFADEGEATKRAIDTVLFFHSAQLESFELSVSLDGLDKGTISKCFQEWVQSASSKRVKQIDLTNILKGCFLDVPTSLFSCDCLTVLNLMWFFIKQIPPDLSGFRSLVTCTLLFIDTNDDVLEHLVSKCPLLENLIVMFCTGLSNVKISAVNLKFLCFAGIENEFSVTVSCPKLATFRVHVCPGMSMLELNSCPSLHLSNVLKELSLAHSLRKVSLHGFGEQVSSLAVLENFDLLEELSIESKCFETDAASIEVLSLKSLKKVHVKVSNFEENEMALLGCLFKSAPLLKTITLALPRCSRYTHEQTLKQILALERPCEATVYITEKYEDYCQKCKGCLYMKN